MGGRYGKPGMGAWRNAARATRSASVALFLSAKRLDFLLRYLSLFSLYIFFHQLLANDSWFMTVMCLAIFAGMLGEIRQFGLNSSSSSCRCVRKSAFYF